MDFELSHLIPAPPNAVARVLLDGDYQNSLSGLGPLAERTVLEQEPFGDGRVRRRVRCVLDMDLPGAARRFLGDANAAWVEEALWHPEKLMWEWRILPEVGGDLLSSSGVITLHGAADEETHRDVTGRVEVRVPFYGGKVERWIVEGLRQAYAEEATRLVAWLQKP